MEPGLVRDLVHTTFVLAGKIVALPRQCPLPWVGVGDPPTVGVSASEFTFNEYQSKLDGTAHVLWKGVVPMEMVDKVVEALRNSTMRHLGSRIQ